ncbi:ATP-binding cassette sub-family D member 3-like [Parasteatoda tepidariorum]|uniref:ATP-binding cassette sub-family D member 3-like n=1 Tax=Parasteatoda tepidariorum TaxID=114398 RepID=UPI0039BCF0EE
MSYIDNRIANPDQLLTQNVDKFCNSVVELYSNISKPLLDIIIFVQRLSSDIGAEGPSLMIAYLILAGLVLTSEEIAFYQGHGKEKVTFLQAFQRLINPLRMSHHFNFSMGYIDNIVTRYWATIVGYLLISRPFITSRKDSLSHGDRVESYYRSGRMLVKLAEAIGRLVLSGRELTRLAGFTARITQLMTVLKDLSQGLYVRTMVTEHSKAADVSLQTAVKKNLDLSLNQAELLIKTT